MNKKYYKAPVAELQEAMTAAALLSESVNSGGSIPELEDSGIEITW